MADARDRERVAFGTSDVQGYRCLAAGETVSFDLIRGDEIHAGTLRRSMENLESYVNLGGLYS